MRRQIRRKPESFILGIDRGFVIEGEGTATKPVSVGYRLYATTYRAVGSSGLDYPQ